MDARRRRMTYPVGLYVYLLFSLGTNNHPNVLCRTPRETTISLFCHCRLNVQ